MSTSSAQLLSAATTLTRNVYQKIIKKNVTERQLVTATRIQVVLFGAFGLYLAITGAHNVVFWMVLFAYVGCGAALGIPLVFGLYLKWVTKEGCLASMIVGSLTVIVWKMTPSLKAILFEGIPGLLAALAALIIVSLMTKPSQDAVKEYEEILEG